MGGGRWTHGIPGVTISTRMGNDWVDEPPHCDCQPHINLDIFPSQCQMLGPEGGGYSEHLWTRGGSFGGHSDF